MIPDHNDGARWRMEDFCMRSDELASSPLAEDVKVNVLLEMCPKALKDHLEWTHTEEDYNKVRLKVLQYTMTASCP